MTYLETVQQVAALYANRFINPDHLSDIIVTMNESFDTPVNEIRYEVMRRATTIERGIDSEYGCDRCGVFVADGDGYYIDADDRVCGNCMLKSS